MARPIPRPRAASETLPCARAKARTRAVGALHAGGGLETLRDVERRHILAVYEAMSNNKSQTARVLGISFQTLHRKLKDYGVE